VTASPGDVPSPPRARAVVVLVSGAGTNLQALLDAAGDPAYGVRVAAVGADRDGTEGIQRARRAGIPTFVCRVEDFPTRADWDAALAKEVARHEPALVVSAGFMRLAGAAFLDRFAGRFVNTHPALLPSFPGRHGARDALAHGVKVTGCTLFVVDAGLDTGPIVAQRAVPVETGDTAESLHARIKAVERRMLVEYVGRMVREGFTVTDREVTMAVRESATEPGGAEQRAVEAPGGEEGSADGRRPVRRALVSVHDKTGLADLARALDGAGVAIVSTGSTARVIAAAGVPVTPVEELTGFPECLDGRVKTLHPRVHAGILADTRNPEHVRQLGDLGVEPFDLVVSNLYPFRDTVASGASPQECIEQIDIGGPSMVRAAAKNHASVAIVTSPAAYPLVVQSVRAGGFTLDERRTLAARAFADTATYDNAVASWMGTVVADTSGGTGFPEWTGATFERAAVLRYGENPHQRAALYTSWRPGVAHADQLHGKEMSYNNYVDADAAVRAAHDHGDRATVAIIKHANPCGIAVGPDVAEAHRRAHACDPTSAFGGVIATNRPVTAEMANQVAEVFAEVLVAPGFEPGALEVLTRKKNIRLLRLPGAAAHPTDGLESRPITGGLLVQTVDRIDAVVDDGDRTGGDDPSRWALVSGAAADEATLADLTFAWRAVRAVRSNAILVARDGASVGIGMGQVNRVDSCHLAVSRAGQDRVTGAVAASDAFFPFADGLQVLIDAGVAAVVTPGGSMRDREVIDAAAAAGLTMYFTGTRHFAH